jgi:uncharacterized Zn finger protein/DNA-binding transcriptional regulator YiaG
MRFWGEYVPVAQRRAKALREMAKLRKKGKDIQPVEIEGRTIARSFWGKGWCDHLESFSDYANRLPRGRTYVRNGSVCHLAIQPGQIEAIVSGSSLYKVSIAIDKLKPAIWKTVKANCSGQIGSMLELLRGKLSNQVMTVVTDQTNGLFPKPSEITLRCNCPDWATMCKHVAAVMYGVGSRLDHRPELLFLLRDVDAQELISTELAVPSAVTTSDAIDAEQIGDIFGIELDAPVAEERVARNGARRKQRAASSASADPSAATGETKVDSSPARPGRRRKVKRNINGGKPGSQPTSENLKQRAAASTATVRIRPTGKSVGRLRKKLGLSVAEFAQHMNVSTASVYRWESVIGQLKLQPRPLANLAMLHQKARQE